MDFTGLLADNGQIEIRNLAERKQGGSTVMAIFEAPPENEVARWLSAAAKIRIIPVQPAGRLDRLRGSIRHVTNL